MKDKTESAESSPVTASASQPTMRGCYEVVMPGSEPLKIGGMLCYNTARVTLAKEQADTLLAARPGCLNFLGV